jgi:hypothetical protein
MEASEIVRELWDGVLEKTPGRTPTRLIESRFADALGLPYIDIPEHHRLFAAGSTEADHVTTVLYDNEHRRDATISSVGVRRLEKLLGRPAIRFCDDNFKTTSASLA